MLKGGRFHAPSPTSVGWLLVCKIFHLTQFPSALDPHPQPTPSLLLLIHRPEQIIIILLKAERASFPITIPLGIEHMSELSYFLLLRLFPLIVNL